jgi:hypothetical protein
LEVIVHEIEQGGAGEFGGADGAGEMVPCEVARLGAEEVEGADVLAGHEDRHGEDAADLMGEQGRAVDRPAGVGWVGKICDKNRALQCDGLQAGAFTEGELQFVVYARRFAAGSKRSAGRAVENQRNGRRVDIKEHHAGLAEQVGGLYPSPPVNSGEELVVDRHI